MLFRSRVIRLLKDLRSNQQYLIRYIVKAIRCDNAGENKLLEQKCIDEILGIIFEYIAPGSPKFNGRVEQNFPILFGRTRTLLNSANLTHMIYDKVYGPKQQIYRQF